MNERRTRAATFILAMLTLLIGVSATPALAVDPPQIQADPAPPDGPPGPEMATAQRKLCQSTGVLPNSDLTKTPPPAPALNIYKARTLSDGAGVTVAVLDTGVNAQPRLPDLAPGGDYVEAGGDGLRDCDAHGTLIAGIIAGAAHPGDGFVGVAPKAKVLSIRVRSTAYEADKPQGFDEIAQLNMDVRTLARAIVHAANLGANIITVPRPICLSIPQARRVDQTMLSSAIGYAVRVRGALVIAGGGDAGSNCKQNPDIDPGIPSDPRNWSNVETVSTPGWFAPDVVTVGFTTATGTAMTESLNGPWISVAGPGTAIESLGPEGTLVNGIGSPDQLTPMGGSAFAAAYVSGVAALLRARFPQENPAEIAGRLQASAHNPARGIDNTVGAGLIDPLAALGYRTPPERIDALFQRPLPIPPPIPQDHTPRVAAGIVIVAAVLIGLAANFGGKLIRRRA